ncbi:hypothetical protein YYC_01144 [Plasmodium yoelii 17X]|uniref:Fam-a protein n=3 Tax=Plasmodium yoelii TaxID=5861 RepID=A0AAE9X2R1_PLAYO|nr:fam-a protein [Plasmodium yoelii]ETB61205.1 hypothetical protein YYC_01144 [Plasmodium yoelii 17X]WBY60542.1 fam-a protein [Plasmodium yoelii yoelii]CDU20358.1 fam-a protein [Plasmodium yoelii]VTZ81318.1 fam-a protein [Plasmodium yoelii]|eukprot:XP_723674.2 fam-a protein [Plasmodium yoelii]
MNKRYITITLMLLSLAGYMQNVALEIETDADGAKNATSSLQKVDILEEYTDIVCDDLREISMAMDHANESSTLLLKLAENMDGYSVDSTENENKIIYSKKIGNMDIGRFHVTIPSAYKYSDVVEKIWDYNDKQKSDPNFINGYLTRVYTPFLIVMEQSKINQENRPLRKKYSVAAKVKLSNDTTVIVCPTRTINFIGAINKKTNLKDFLENTKPIQTDIGGEEALIKLASNIAGYIIKHRGNNVEVTYINAIYNSGNSTNFDDDKSYRDIIYTNIQRLAQRM